MNPKPTTENCVYYYILAGGCPVPEPSEIRWYEWMTANAEELRVDWSLVAGVVQVSTAFVGFSEQSGDTDLWQTMVKGGVLDGRRYRYPDRASAIKGHKQVVDQVGWAENGRRVNGSGSGR